MLCLSIRIAPPRRFYYMFLLYARCNLYGDVSMILKGISFVLRDAWWPSGRASDSGARGRGSILTHVLKHDAFTSQK